MSDIKKTVSSIPHKPGVYRFFGIDDELLYIGKAKDLKNRVSSYFQEGRPKNERLSLMISQIIRIEYTVVATEKESLILEANLIHHLQPRYNVQLKDDKSYVYVRITGGVIPSISIVRRKFDPQSQYFGPYTKKSGIIDTLRTLRTIFPYCQERFEKKRPCSYYTIKQCDGICIGIESRVDYMQKIEQITRVLKGESSLVEAYISDKIQSAVSLSNYELASLWRDRKNILLDTIADQKIVLPVPVDIDLMTIVRQYDESGLGIGSVFVQNIRSGRVININNFLLSGGEGREDCIDFLGRFFGTYYNQQSDKADVIIQSYYIGDSDAGITKDKITADMKEVLESLGDIKVYVNNTFKEGQKQISELLEYSVQNALIYLQRNRLGQKLSMFEENNLFATVVKLQNSLGLSSIPRRIECYDISHLSGTYVYGSMVVFIDGRQSKKHYRLFKTKEQNNDFENHKEVLTRRFERCLSWYRSSYHTTKNPWQLPDLIVVDGGKGQLSSDNSIVKKYKTIFKEEGYPFDVNICALAKKEEEVFVLGHSCPIMLSGDEKHLMQRIRDEAHRFAITNNRKARIKSLSKSRLDSIDGIGPVTKQKLLNTFGSVEEVIQSLTKNPELLYELVGQKMTKKLKDHFGIL